MKQEAHFLHGTDATHVNLDTELAGRARHTLEIELHSEYYLRLPNKAYLPFVIFCLTSKTNLTKKLDAILSKIPEGQRQEIQHLYLQNNEKRDTFIGPYQLEIFSNTANYNFQLFQQSHHLFDDIARVYHPLNEFKKAAKVAISYYPSLEPLGQKLTASTGQVVYLIKDGDDLVICAYSSRAKAVEKHGRVSRESVQEERLRKESTITEPGQQTSKLKKQAAKEQLKEGEQHIKEQQIKQQEFVEEEKFDPEQYIAQDNKKLHFNYTLVLVAVLALLIYVALADVDLSLWGGVPVSGKPILEHLVERIDAVASWFAGLSA